MKESTNRLIRELRSQCENLCFAVSGFYSDVKEPSLDSNKEANLFRIEQLWSETDDILVKIQAIYDEFSTEWDNHDDI